MSESARQSQSTVRIAMCCAGVRAPALDPIRAHLVRRGAVAELVPGVDSNSGLLVSAIERAGPSGLYVIFRTAELGPLQIDVLKQLLAAHGIPNSRCLVVPFDPQKPQSAVRAVVAALSPPAPGGSLSQVRGRISQTKAPTAPPSRLATGVAKGSGASESGSLFPPSSSGSSSAPLLPQQAPVVGPPPRPTIARVSPPPRPARIEPQSARSGTIASSSPDGDSMFGIAGTTSRHDAAMSVSLNAASVQGAAISASLRSPPLSQAEMSGTHGAAATEFPTLLRGGVTSRFRSFSTRIHGFWRSMKLDRKSRWAFVGGGAGLACMTAMMLVVCQAKEAIPSAGNVPMLANAHAEAAAASADAPGESPDLAQPLMVSGQASEADPERSGRQAGGEPQGDDPLDRALLAREVRSLDVLLFVPEETAAMRYQEAVEHCAAKKVGGVDGWRLPSIGELNTLARATMLSRRFAYWSQTSADTFGDQHLVLFGRSRKIYPRSDRWRGARAFCVRTRTPSGEPVPADVP